MSIIFPTFQFLFFFSLSSKKKMADKETSEEENKKLVGAVEDKDEELVKVLLQNEKVDVNFKDEVFKTVFYSSLLLSPLFFLFSLFDVIF